MAARSAPRRYGQTPDDGQLPFVPFAQHVMPWTHTYPVGLQPPHRSPRQQRAFLQLSRQTRSQAPQASLSVKRSWHVVPQQVSPAPQVQLSVLPQPSGIVPQKLTGQVAWVQQLPAAQIWPGAQRLSQEPQFSGSVWRLVHWSPQQVWPSSQHS
jgi:hypothetical protein